MAKKVYDYDEMLKKYGVEASGEKPKEVGDEEWEKYRMAYLQKSAAEDVDAELSRAKEQAAVSQELARGYLAQYLKGTGLSDIGVSQSAILESEANYGNNLANLDYAASAEKRQIENNYRQGISEIGDKYAEKYLANYNGIVNALSSADTAYTADAIKEYVDKNKSKAKGYESELDELVAESYRQEAENFSKQLAEASTPEEFDNIKANYSDTTFKKFENEYREKENSLFTEGRGKIVGATKSYKKRASRLQNRKLNAVDFGGKTYEIKITLDKDAYNKDESAEAKLPDPSEYNAGTILAIEKNGRTSYWYRGNTYEKWYRMEEWQD